MSAIDSLPISLRRYLRDFAVRRMRQRLVRRLGLALLLFAATGALACLLDRILALSGLARLILLILCGSLGFAALAPALRAYLRRSIDWYQTALSVERRHPTCGERLVTIISRLLGPDRDRGSLIMIERIAGELVEDVRAYPIRELLPARRLAPPWIATGIVLAIVAALWCIPALDMPRLVARFVQPLGSARPVTTTCLLVTPGDTDLVESQPLHVRVQTRRLGDSAVVLHLRRQGSDWFTMNMSAEGDRVFDCSLGPIDQDLEYFVTGGDATSDVYHLRILRKPVVTNYEIHCDYPSTTALPARTVWNTDGLIEAPAGTRATLRIHSSEPLSAATLTVGTQALAMKSTDDPTVRQATLTVTKDQNYEVGLGSTRGMVGAGVTKLAIKVIPDHAPTAKLLSPLEDQWLAPTAKLSLIYDAADDFALGALDLQVHLFSRYPESGLEESTDAVNHDRERDLPLRIVGDQRRQVGECHLDLAALSLSLGDVATLRLRAVDRKGQTALSQPIHLVIAPSSISHRKRELPKALSSAAALMRKWAAAQDLNDKEALAEQLRATTLRAVFECQNTDDAAGMARLADTLEQVLSGSAKPDPADADANLVKRFDSLAQAVEAKCLLLDRSNLAALDATRVSDNSLLTDEFRRSFESLQESVQKELRTRLAPKSGRPLDLKDLVKPWDQMDRSDIDFAEAAYGWFDALFHGRSPGILVERLDTAAKVETVRPNGDLLWARDLERASIAAATFENFKPAKGPPPAAARLAAVLSVLQREHRIRRADETSPSQRAESDEVVRARQELAEWASDIPESQQTPAGQLEALTLHASAETVLRNFSNTLAIDRALAGEVTPAAERSARSEFAVAETARQMDLVQALDAVVLQQEAISNKLEQTASISGPVGTLAEQQSRLVESLARVVKNAGRPGEERRLAAARKILALDKVLASLTNFAEHPDRARESAGELAQDSVELMGALPILQRSLGSDAAVAKKIQNPLLPLVNALAESATDEFQPPPDPQALKLAVEQVRPLLNDTAELIVKADALAAAQFHAQRAARMLGRKTVEFGPTLGQTSAALASLREARDHAVHRAALARAVRLPAFAKAIWEEPATPAGLALPIAGLNPPAPPGFEDPIKAYFHAISQADRRPVPAQ